ncbi:zinc finger protein 2 isoform X3 [Athalia rosae]|uniref:zinc finger protein 2 isoform X3 n=1 Tax=Athalia rosae TaxID=37344 RepID=UPI002034776A|nr:zinc finger protein 2 isoform X3 [Athalia rosae]
MNSANLSYGNMSSEILCRLCGLQCAEYVDIYKDRGKANPNLKMEMKISSCLQIAVSRDDILPKTVCQKCCVRLEESFEFYQTSNKVQLILMEAYSLHLTNDKCKEDEIFDQCSWHTPQYTQSPSNKNSESVTDETSLEIQVNGIKLEKQCSQQDMIELVSPPSFDDNLANGESEIGTLVHQKSYQLKKFSSSSDAPASPRLADILKGYPWPCTICVDRVLDSPQALREHCQMEHQQLPIFKCITCEKQYDHYQSFTKHIKLHRATKRYTCKVCEKSFAQKTILQAHATVHTTARPHVCHTCGKTFKNFSSLQNHVKMHLPDEAKEKYSCEFCQKEFATKHTLETHRKIHTGERDFVCDICGKSFIAKGSLDYHLLSHTGDKNHVCPSCGKAFKTSRLLGKHRSVHTGIKPHQCDVCGKQFRERGALREHSRIHTGAMPYSCEVCGKCFRFKGVLTVHQRQHTGERPYACLECQRYFTNWPNYNKHMKRIHQYDMSNKKNSGHRSRSYNVQVDLTNATTDKSAVTVDEINQNSNIADHSPQQVHNESSAEAVLDAD